MQFQELFSEFNYLFSFLNDAVIFRSSRDETYCIFRYFRVLEGTLRKVKFLKKGKKGGRNEGGKEERKGRKERKE